MIRHRNVLRCKLYSGEDETTGEGIYTDFWIEENLIISCLVPLMDDDTVDEDNVNIYTENHTFTIKKEPHIVEYVTKAFVEPGHKFKTI